MCASLLCTLNQKGTERSEASIVSWNFILALPMLDTMRKDSDSHRGCACLLPFTVHRKVALLIRAFLMIRFDQLKILQPKLSREFLQKLRQSFSVFLFHSAELER